MALITGSQISIPPTPLRIKPDSSRRRSAISLGIGQNTKYNGLKLVWIPKLFFDCHHASVFRPIDKPDFASGAIIFGNIDPKHFWITVGTFHRGSCKVKVKCEAESLWIDSFDS